MKYYQIKRKTLLTLLGLLLYILNLSRKIAPQEARKPGSVPPEHVPGWRSFIWDTGFPVPQAAYPEASGGQPLPGQRRDASLFGLAPGGVCRAIPCHQGMRWALTPPFHPYRTNLSGGLFSVALSVPCGTWVLPSALPCGARTFLCRLFFRQRPPGLLRCDFYSHVCQSVCLTVFMPFYMKD